MDEENPYKPSATVAHIPSHVKDLPRLLEVAKWQKYSIYAMTAFMVFVLAQVVVFRRHLGGSPIQWMGFPLACAVAFSMLRMSKGVFGNWIAGVVVGLIGMIPCVGLIAFLLINQMAVSMFTKTGFSCGFFGMWNADYDRLEGEVMKLEKQKLREERENSSRPTERAMPVVDDKADEDGAE